MSVEDQLHADRDARRQGIAALGLDPYGQKFPDAIDIETARNRLHIPAYRDKTARVAGRVVSKNDRGKLKFFHIRDETASIQVMVSAKAVDERTWKVAELLQPGDIVGVEGVVGTSNTGEVSIKVLDQAVGEPKSKAITFLSKSMTPWPDKFHGLADVETLRRNRHLELVHRDGALKTLQQRSRMVWKIRQTLQNHGFTEVETPILQPIAGGAAARPFKTHHNTYGVDLYLRIAPELYLKKLLVGGMEKIFEIGKNFRNEGIDKTHNPEFTMLELYEAYGDFESMQYITRRICEGLGLDAIANAQAISYADVFERHVGINILPPTGGPPALDPNLANLLTDKLGLPAPVPLTELLDTAFDRFVQPNLTEPTFVFGYPAIMCPLAKPIRSWGGVICERWELFVGGIEIANAYTELNDPDLQRRNFEIQLGLQPGQHDPRIDYDFLDALTLGMPPAGGLGIGIDRLAMLMTGTDAIRDVITFPLVRPRNEQ